MLLHSESFAVKSSPYFLSRLSSISVPENGDATFACKISGNPKPEITWCKNGHDIREVNNFYNYEITDDNLIHTLRLFRCTEEQAGVYRIVASNCFGRVQSSAFLNVTSGPKSEAYKTLHSNSKSNVGSCRANDVTAYHWESSNQAAENKEDLVEKNDSTHECFSSLGSSQSPATDFNGLSTEQTPLFHPMENGISPPMENQYKNTHCLGDNMCAKNVLHPEENNCSILDMPPNTSNLLYDSFEMPRECTERKLSGDCAEREVDVVDSSQVDSKPPSQINDHTNSCSVNAEDLAACQTSEYAKTHEESCLNEVLRNNEPSWSHASAPLENQTSSLEDSYKNAGSDFELLLGRTFLTADDSFVSDRLEYLECSDVMTEEAYQEWERKLKFLLESDEEDESTLGNDCDGCAYFLGEMPRLFQVSNNTVPMDASIGFCAHQSKPKEVAVRSDLSAYNPSLLPTGMTLTVGQQQSKAPTSKDKEKYKPPVASMAIENDCPRIEEENSSNSQSAECYSFVRSESMENELLGMESSSHNLSGSFAATEKQDMDRSFSQKNLQKFAKVKEKATKGKGKDNVAGPTKASKRPLKKLHPKELHTSASRTIQSDRSLDSAVLLHGCHSSDPNEAHQETANSSPHYGLLHSKGGDENSPWEGEQISSLSEGNQLPNENAALMVKPQDTEAETMVPIGNEPKLFITEPELDDAFVSTLSSAKNISVLAENPTLEEVSGKNGFQMDNATLENSTNFSLPYQTQAIDQWEPCGNRPMGAQTIQVTNQDNTVSCNVFFETFDHTPSISHQEGLSDIPTPQSVPVRQMERAIACRTKPHEIKEVKTICDSPCAENLSKVDLQATLECSEPEAREADLSLIHEQLQKLLYEEEERGDDFTGTSREVKSLAAGPDPAKEAEGLNVTGDESPEPQLVPGHLTEDKQLVTELAIVLERVRKDYVDCKSLQKMDETCSNTSMGKNSLAPAVETDAMCLGADFGHGTEKPSVHLLSSSLSDAEICPDDNQSQTQSDNNRPVQMSASLEGKIMVDNASLPHAAESPLRFTEAPNSALEHSQETLVELPAHYLGRLPYTEQGAHCRDGSTEKQSDAIPTDKSHVTRIKGGANLNELPLKEDSSSNFSGKNVDPCTSEGHSSVKAVDKSTGEKIQEKGTALDVNVQSDSNCGIYHVLTGNNSKGFQAILDAGNYSYHIQKHNSDLAVASIADWDGADDTDIKEPVSKTSCKGKFLTNVPIESNKNEENAVSQERRECRAIAEETASGSEIILEILPSDSQQSTSGKKASIDDDLCAIEKGMRTDIISCCTLDFGNAVASIIRNECGNSGKDSQGASKMTDVVCTQERNQEDANQECNLKSSGAEFSRVGILMPIDSMQTKAEKDTGEPTPELRQNQYQRVEEKKKTHVVQYEGDIGQTEISVSHDFEEAEVEPYMRVLVDPEESIHSWLDHTVLQQKEHQKIKEEHQIQITLCERDTTACQKFLGSDLEEVEVEPYMRVLMNTEEIHSWHESIDYVHPYCEQTELSTGACVKASTSHNLTGTFTTNESKNLNTSEHVMEASVNIMPSENRSSFQDKLPQGGHLLCLLEEGPEAPLAFKEERSTLQGTSKLCKAPSAHSSLEDMKCKQETIKKILSKVQVKKLCLEAKENACNSTGGLKNVSKAELGQKEDTREQWKPPSKKDSKAPKLLKKIQAELLPDFSGNIQLCCQFVEIHEDATITWTKDSQLLARVHRRAGDEFPVSLAIVQAGKKDQGLYCCCLKNTYGKATADFKLTSEVLEHLSSFRDVEGLEEIEFSELMFREDFICDSYFSNSLHGRITTEELHFGEGVHRKAFRSKVMQGLVPVFSPGHPCVLKVHNAIAYGTKNNDELVKKNYKLALQECYVQNTAREYAKIYAAETKQLEGFGEVPEIIPIFLIHRPKSNIPYATVEEELIGEFVKYSIRDGKEINFMRRDSEAGQKSCTFQHWVYERTSGSLLITDMQGVGMKLTDVGIATLAKGYKGFKGNCSISFIDQFKALHQCNKYCEMLGLRPLQTGYQKQRKPAAPKSKPQQPSSSTVKKTAVGVQAVKKT